MQAELNRGLLNNTLADAESSLGDAKSFVGDGSGKKLAVTFVADADAARIIQVQ